MFSTENYLRQIRPLASPQLENEVEKEGSAPHRRRLHHLLRYKSGTSIILMRGSMSGSGATVFLMHEARIVYPNSVSTKQIMDSEGHYFHFSSPVLGCSARTRLG